MRDKLDDYDVRSLLNGQYQHWSDYGDYTNVTVKTARFTPFTAWILRPFFCPLGGIIKKCTLFSEKCTPFSKNAHPLPKNAHPLDLSLKGL